MLLDRVRLNFLSKSTVMRHVKKIKCNLKLLMPTKVRHVLTTLEKETVLTNLSNHTVTSAIGTRSLLTLSRLYRCKKVTQYIAISEAGTALGSRPPVVFVASTLSIYTATGAVVGFRQLVLLGARIGAGLWSMSSQQDLLDSMDGRFKYQAEAQCQ